MVFMRQALISQKVRPRLFSKGQSQLVDKDPISGTTKTSEVNTYIAAPTAVRYSPAASKILTLHQLIH